MPKLQLPSSGEFDPDNSEVRRRSDLALLARKLDRTHAAMRLKIQGLDYPEIAQNLGYSSAAEAAKDVRDALEQELLINEQHSSEVLRMIELKRLNTLYNALMGGVERGNTRAIEIAVKVSERISKLTGAEAPQKVEMATLESVSQEIERVKQEIAARQKALSQENEVLDAEVVE